MSFVDLMKDDIWSEADIINRTENIIRSLVSREAEGIINRKISGALLGQYTMTPEEQAEVQSFATLTFQARADGDAARADNELLKKTLQYEATYKKHESLSAQPLSEDPDLAAEQTAELDALQAELDAAPTEVVDLAVLRGRLIPEEVVPVDPAPVDPVV